ncbi:hypothetical protein [uncultured Tateyamaria sp.]|uniref:hypothetical protein n=1 Tax=Tateyamaria sp. 1078 TaxID=3417464 RepID=UPI00261A83A9|nr:hypothetical protein [uncultured Tateyamaria sp.]
MTCDADEGYHAYAKDWWVRPKCTGRFQCLTRASTYREPYFDGYIHPGNSMAQILID